MTVVYSHPTNPSDGAQLRHYLIAGAPKCGTTTLANTLAAHPEIALSSPKEPNFFVTQAGFRDGGAFAGPAESGTLERGAKYYHSLFELDARSRIYGDASTAYLHCAETPSLLAELSPDVRIILILREPIARIYSHYLHDRRRTGLDRGSFEAIVHGNTEEFQRYVWNTMYSKHIRNFLEFIPSDQIRILEYTHLFQNFRSIVAELFDFLGVDKAVQVPDRPKRHNEAADPRSMRLAELIFQLTRSGIGERIPLLRAWPFRQLKGAVLKANSRPIDRRRSQSVELRDRIISLLKPDIEELGELQHAHPGSFIAPQQFSHAWISPDSFEASSRA